MIVPILPISLLRQWYSSKKRQSFLLKLWWGTTSQLGTVSSLLGKEFDYFINLKSKLKKKKNSNIILFENSSLDEMERMIYYSLFAISCHSGFLVQISGTNNSKIIDIINQRDFIWYSCWVPKNTLHKFVYKSYDKEKVELEKILFDVLKAIKN